MNNFESTFRFIFIAVLIANLSITIYHRLQAAKSDEKISRVEEGKVILFLRVVCGLSLWISILAYAIFPGPMRWSTIPLTLPLRWIGAGFASLSVPMLYWVLRNLGKNLTDTIFIRKDHTLVTTGPYHWVRHPFYTVVFGSVFALSLVVANWFIGLMTILMFIIIVIRTDKEEEMLIKRFGDDYRRYMQRTGRFLPRFGIPK
jgi:protein-S-isoprenylcysteine O-methyltransferase Ste14